MDAQFGVNNLDPTLLNGVAITVIKNQSVLGQHFSEAEFLPVPYSLCEKFTRSCCSLGPYRKMRYRAMALLCSFGQQKKRIGLLVTVE